VKPLKVLIACERSGVFRDAFLALGHDAISCDLFPTESPGPHHEGDVRPLLRERWDLVIAHPVCRFLTNAGAKHLYVGGRRYNPDGSENRMCPDRVKGAAEGAAFFNDCLNANAARIAVENPIMHWLAKALTRSDDITQTVQPWWFGDETFKATTFRLRGLPPLIPTDKLNPPKAGTDEHKAWSWVHRMSPGPERERLRSQSQPGIAMAAALQWGGDARSMERVA
jgi:hypothetical protein